MNFLAHCFLSKGTAFSVYGNLLGDFITGADLQALPNEVLLGLENHKLVDRFTDAHSALEPLKTIVSKDRRRFIGIMSDVVFDYFLIKHWRDFSSAEIMVFVDDIYAKIQQVLPVMHPRMQQSMQFMLNHNGLLINNDIAGVSVTLNRLSKRIRFKNKLHGAGQEIEENYSAFETAFLILMPELIAKVEKENLES